MSEEDILYQTRIVEHLNRASEARQAAGDGKLTIKELSQATLIPYQTVRWYMQTEIANPNYAVVDVIRRFLNQFYRMSSAGYIYRVGEPPEEGQVAGVLAPAG